MILLIDDSDVIRNTLREIIERKGIKVLEAENGQEALELFETNAEDIALLFVDINMPVRDGISFLKDSQSLRKDAVTIMLTSEADHSLMREAKRFGAKGWIVKPPKEDLVLQMIERFFPTNEERPE
jgi:two-component system chemotaxis response regulator CheY